MKKTLLVFILLLNFAINSNAQGIKYFPDPDLDKFVGTWVYQNGDKSISIILKKTKIISKDMSYDIIEGYHTFKIGENSIEDSHKITLKAGSTIDIDGGKKTPNQLHFDFYDFTKKKGSRVELTITPDNLNELKWSMRNIEGARIHRPGEKPFDQTFTLPKAMTFKRQ